IPTFLTLTSGAAGTAILSSNRPLTLADTGDHTVKITASSGGNVTIQEFDLVVLNPLPSIVLNEYNAVSSTNFLNGGDLTTDEDGGAASLDTHFGRVLGNGGAWFEFVVVGAGPVDMRGWTVEIGNNNGGLGFSRTDRLILSNHADWQAVPSGTILTFIDRNTAQGGRDTGFAIRDNSATTGEIWSNVWIGDLDHVNAPLGPVAGYTVSGGVVNGITIDNNNTQFQVKNTLGQIVFGPAGEGVVPLSGLNDKEIFELEGNPNILVSPTDIASETAYGYDDSASGSTFGYPNTWTEGAETFTQVVNLLPPPEISVEQSGGVEVPDGGSFAFGSLATGANTTRTFTIRNIGYLDLTGLTITTDGANAADFTVTASPVAPLGPDGSTTLTVKFAPTTAGSKTAAIHIASNDDDEASYDIMLKGSAFVKAPEISVQQPVGSELTDGKTQKSFGTVKIGKKSTVKTFTIKNVGTANLTGLVLSVK
ncbi:MAG: choice-of-anchor D domain-containing protein, partial [Verrucomicrobiaceae bacterium]